MSHRLLYVGDVPVEASYHGSALLYRLLSEHEPEELRIAETGSASLPDRRLQRVKYEWSPLAKTRWLNTRFHPYVVTYHSAAAKRLSTKLLTKVKEFEFDSVLTVAHGFGWLTASALAEYRSVPLHLIVHDDWPRVAQVPTILRSWLDRSFAKTYRQAQSRLCVSPMMRDSYRQRYGVAGDVLYPMRDVRAPRFEYPGPRVGSNDHPFTIAFAGTINSAGYIEVLQKLSIALEPVGGRLLLFGPLNQSEAEGLDLARPNIVFGGLLESSTLIKQLRQEADALFVPMSFAAADRLNMEMAFPSKLADYTAVGAPLLIYGPEYCSAVHWAKANPGVAVVVTSTETDALVESVRRLASSPAERALLGTQALDVGNRYFSHDSVQGVFNSALQSVTPPQITRVADFCSAS
jgi:glycosyltransferase involved in cell wall biosynthesis